VPRETVHDIIGRMGFVLDKRLSPEKLQGQTVDEYEPTKSTLLKLFHQFGAKVRNVASRSEL